MILLFSYSIILTYDACTIHIEMIQEVRNGKIVVSQSADGCDKIS